MSALVNDTPTSQELTSAMAAARKALAMGGMSDVMVNKAMLPTTTAANVTPTTPTPTSISAHVNLSANQGSVNVGEAYGSHYPKSKSQLGQEHNAGTAHHDDELGPGLLAMGDLGLANGMETPKIRLTPTVKLLATPNPVDPKRKFVCPYEDCTKSYGKSSHLRSHLTWHTGMKPFVCQAPNCGKGFTRSDELNRHVRTHTGEKPFECIQCSKKFSRSDHLTKHLATHTKHQTMSNYQPPTKRQRQQHSANQNMAGDRLSKSPAEEADAKKVYVEMKSPAQHMRYSDGLHFMAALVGNAAQQQHHQQQQQSKKDAGATEPTPPPPPPLQRAPLKIKLERPGKSDNYQIVRPPPLQRPMTSSESEEDMPHELIVPVSTMVCPPSPEIKTEPSDEAHMPEMNAAARLATGVHTLAHANSNHSAAGVAHTGATAGANASAVAASANASASDYDMPHFGHFMAELTSPTYDTEPRPFHCNQCTKSFKRQDDLNRHVRTHTGEKPYACSQCERRFMRSDHLKKHMNTHRRQR